jgi:ethanolamine ammonia-lyase large subunit
VLGHHYGSTGQTQCVCDVATPGSYFMKLPLGDTVVLSYNTAFFNVARLSTACEERRAPRMLYLLNKPIIVAGTRSLLTEQIACQRAGVGLSAGAIK